MTNNNQPKGTGFVNLSRYLGANQNNKLGSAVSNNVSGRVGDVKSNLGQLKNDFAQRAGENALGTQSNVEARTKALESIMGGNTALTPQTEQDFAKFRTGAYAGPTELDATKTASTAAKAGQVERDVKGLGTVEGRGNLLRQTVGKPGYSQGQQKLDTLLLGQQSNELNSARRDATGLGRSVEEARQGAQQIGQTQIAKAQQFGRDTQGALKTNTGSIVSDLEARAAQANQQRPEIYNSLVNAIQQGDITPEQAQMLGLEEGTQTYGLNFDPFVSQSQIAADKSNIAGEIDKAKLSALAKLSGQTGVDAINTAAEAYRGPLNVRKEDLLKGINDRKSAYEDLLNRGVDILGQGGVAGALKSNQRQNGESTEDYLNRIIQNRGNVGDTYKNSSGQTQQLNSLNNYFKSIQSNIDNASKTREKAQADFARLGNNFATSKGNQILYGQQALDHILQGSLQQEQSLKNELNQLKAPLDQAYNKVLK